jgi:3-oxoacyl-[acyl-carrier-protein] synthase-1/3-oxoacyl-[acyl-carrier-protein] synthase II
MTQSEPVAITGLGCICAVGPTLEACMAGLFFQGREAAPAPRLPARFSASHPNPYPVFEVPDFADVPGLLRTSALGLHAAREALRDAGLEQGQLDSLRVGVCMGTTVGSAMNDEAFCRAYRAGGDPDLAPMDQILNSNPAAVLARAFGFTGPCQTVVNACSSGTDAIGLGAAWIASGRCDLVLAGGADELSRITYNGFISLKISSTTACQPFDLNRRGLNLGEGAAVVVLESERSRAARQRHARSFVLGYGAACDAYHQTAPKPDGAGLKRSIAEALAGRSIAPSDVAFVNAHGTGTPDNDRVESRVLAEVLPGVPFLSTKGYTGHTLGAAGAIEAVFTAACLEQGRIPANVGFATPDPELGGTPVPAETPITGCYALSESLAFGGNNAVVLLGRGEAP